MKRDQGISPIKERDEILLGNTLLDGIDQQDGVMVKKSLINKSQTQAKGQQEEENGDPPPWQVDSKLMVYGGVQRCDLHGACFHPEKRIWPLKKRITADKDE
jgi:hypothetical protein